MGGVVGGVVWGVWVVVFGVLCWGAWRLLRGFWLVVVGWRVLWCLLCGGVLMGLRRRRRLWLMGMLCVCLILLLCILVVILMRRRYGMLVVGVVMVVR